MKSENTKHEDEKNVEKINYLSMYLITYDEFNRFVHRL